jgi:hypothetical protein
MTLTRLSLVFIVAAVLALPASAGAATTNCSGSVAQGFFTHIKATDVSCPTAKSVIRRWIRASGFGHVDPPPTVRVGGWTCKNKFESSQGESSKLTCTASGGRKIKTVGSP